MNRIDPQWWQLVARYRQWRYHRLLLRVQQRCIAIIKRDIENMPVEITTRDEFKSAAQIGYWPEK